MRFLSSKIYGYLLFGIFLLNLLNISCSKDNDLLDDLFINNENEISIEEINPVTEVSEEVADEVKFENRYKSFPPIHDAYVQSGKGFNQNLMRLEKDNRTGYLMFDLSPINSIGGVIKAVTLQVTVKYDEGDGELKIYQGISNEWTEATLTNNTAPSFEIELGSLSKQFNDGETEYIDLDHELIAAENYSMVLT